MIGERPVEGIVISPDWSVFDAITGAWLSNEDEVRAALGVWEGGPVSPEPVSRRY